MSFAYTSSKLTCQGHVTAKKLNTHKLRQARLSAKCSAVQESTASEGVSVPGSAAPARNGDRLFVDSISPPIHIARQRSLQRSSEFSSRVQADQDALREKEKDQKLVTVKFWLQFHTEYGQRIKVVGSDEALGAWTLQDAPELRWSKNDRWHVEVTLPAGGVYEYKYVVLSSNGVHPVGWQRGNNSVLAVRNDDDKVEVYDNWEGQPGASVVAAGQSATREIRLKNWAAEMEAIIASQRSELRRTRMELAAAQEDARVARADAARLKSQLTRAQTEQLQSERRVCESENHNQLLQARLAESSLSFHKAFQTAQELLSAGKGTTPVTDVLDISLESDNAVEEVDVNDASVDEKLSDSLDFLSMLRNSQFELGRPGLRQLQQDVRSKPSMTSSLKDNGIEQSRSSINGSTEKGEAQETTSSGNSSSTGQAAPVMPNFNGSTVQQFVARLKSGLGNVVPKQSGTDAAENVSNSNANDIPLRLQEQVNLARARSRTATNNGQADGQDPKV